MKNTHLKISVEVAVCQGPKGEAEFHQLWDSMLGFECLELLPACETRWMDTSNPNVFVTLRR